MIVTYRGYNFNIESLLCDEQCVKIKIVMMNDVKYSVISQKLYNDVGFDTVYVKMLIKNDMDEFIMKNKGLVDVVNNAIRELHEGI